MSNAFIQVTEHAGVIRITLNRADKRNALTRAMLSDLMQAVQSVSEATRLVVLSANGPVFCAGMDLQEMQATSQLPNSLEVWQQDSDIYRRVVEGIFFLPCPTLCAAQGPAVAGGVGLVLACDMVIASHAASFALPEPKRGITASMVLPLLEHRVGPGPAGWLLLSGQTLTSAVAERWGVIHQLADDAALPTEVDKAITAVLSNAPGALRSTKQQLLERCGDRIRTDWDRGSQLSANARAQPEAREGLQAFLEKRFPNWAPR